MTYTIKEYNCESGETVEREMTAAETKAHDDAVAVSKKAQKAEAKAEADKVAAKQSAQAKLAALGLTEEEVASILG